MEPTKSNDVYLLTTEMRVRNDGKDSWNNTSGEILAGFTGLQIES